MTTVRVAPRTALFLPASNPRAIAKARALDADLLILDLEDAVRDEAKTVARAAAVEAAAGGFGVRPCAIRINGIDSAWHAEDLAAVAGSACDYVVVPKVGSGSAAATVAEATGKPLLAMIETPRGVLAASEVAGVPEVAGLLAGVNDLRAELGIPSEMGREGLALALQTIVLAARAHGCWAIDGVFNALDDAEGLAAECRHGRALGFDGKSLIHPGQISAAATAFGPSAAELEEARALVEAAQGGAERFRGRMIEGMHVAQARSLLERAHFASG